MDGFHDPAPISAAVLDAVARAAAGHDLAGSFPHDSIAVLRDTGLLAMTVPRRLGGGGGGLARAAVVVEAVGTACASTALVLAMQFSHQNRVAANERMEPTLRDRVGTDAVTTGALINALRVEPALGTPARGGLPETIARRTGTGWSISGRKIYSTGAPGLQWMLVWARTDEDTPRVGHFLVPADTPGIRIEQSWDQLGLRASGSDDVVFTDVAVPAENAADIRLPADWRGPDPQGLAWGIVLTSAVYLGVAKAARNWVVRFLHERKPSNLGAALATLPRMQEAVGAIEERLAVNDALLATAIRMAEAEDTPNGQALNLFKTTLAENAVRAVEQALLLTGNHGLSRGNPLERHWRDVVCARVHTPQADTVHLAAGRAALGLSS
jgi:alkylation response protein AidB-like acyl-CoA dehydrogenase